MSIKLPSPIEIMEFADEIGLDLTDEDTDWKKM
jgi:hypothetical protein